MSKAIVLASEVKGFRPVSRFVVRNAAGKQFGPLMVSSDAGIRTAKAIIAMHLANSVSVDEVRVLAYV